MLSASPVGSISSPQTVTEGTQVTVSAAGSYDPDGWGMLDYQWDLNGDGYFGDASGEQVQYDPRLWAGSTPDGSPVRVRVQISDWTDPPTIVSTTVTLENVAPVISNVLLSATSIYLGDYVSISGDAFDPAMADSQNIRIEWGTERCSRRRRCRRVPGASEAARRSTTCIRPLASIP
jgi:hypothetical protein